MCIRDSLALGPVQVTSNVRGQVLVLGEGWVALFVLVASESELSSFTTFVAWSWSPQPRPGVSPTQRAWSQFVVNSAGFRDV